MEERAISPVAGITAESPVVGTTVDGLAVNTNILETLREKKSFSIERYGSLDEFFEKMTEELTWAIAGFVGKEIELNLAEVVLFSGSDDSAADEGASTLTRISDSGGRLASFVSIDSTVFRSILGALLGSYSRPVSVQNQIELSVAELKLMQRFVHQIGAALFNTLSATHFKDAEAEVIAIDGRQLIAEADKSELISITIEISADDHIWQIKVILPLEILEPSDATGSNNALLDMKRQEERRWKEKLQGNINKLPIPLRAQIVSMEMALVDVARLAPGNMLDVQFDLTNVRIIDGDENCAFLSNIELNEYGFLLRVAGDSGSRGV